MILKIWTFLNQKLVCDNVTRYLWNDRTQLFVVHLAWDKNNNSSGTYNSC